MQLKWCAKRNYITLHNICIEYFRFVPSPFFLFFFYYRLKRTWYNGCFDHPDNKSMNFDISKDYL